MNNDQWQTENQGGIEPYSPFSVEGQRTGNGGRLSVRAYGLLLTALVLAGFLVMGACASLFSNVSFLLAVSDNYFVISVVSFIASIAGIIMMGRGKSAESVGLSLAGYILFVFSFGFATSTIFLMYSAQTISTAFLATAGIVTVFACLGIAVPHVFEKISGVLGGCLLALIVVQIVMAFLAIDQTLIDFLVIVVFCGFIGYDFHKAMFDEPTVVNAVYNASELFLDIINVFIRVLSLLSRRD